jgi:SunS family peptide S-glycosyltransferase
MELKQHYPQSSLYSDLGLILNVESCKHIELPYVNDLKSLVANYEKADVPDICCGIMTYNEERCIYRCLNSIVGEFDEIILLDSFSTDNTVKIVKENFPEVKIFFEPWINDFSHHRNQIIKHASTQWVYFIDADNWYDTENKGKAKRIAKLIEFLNIKCLISPLIHEHNGNIQIDNRKMFPLKYDIKFYGKVHEEPLFPDYTVPLNIDVNIKVHHDGYDATIVDQRKKIERNLNLIKEMIEQEPQNPKWFYFYGRELYEYKEDIQVVKNILLKAVTLYKSSSYKRYYFETILLFCDVLLQTGDFKMLYEHIMLLEKEFPECIDTDYFKASMIFVDIRNKTKNLIDSLEKSIGNSQKYSVMNPKLDHIRYLISNMYLFLLDIDSVKRTYNQIESDDFKNAFKNNVDEIKKIDL